MSLLSNYLPRGIVPVSQQTITESITLSPTESQLALVVLVGQGGSGGVAYGAAGENILHAQGGNAGGVCMQLVRFKAGETYTFTINSAGAAQSRTSAGATNGQAGGSVVLTSTAIDTITANGGNGGVAAQYDIDTGTYGTSIGYNTQTFGTGADLIFDGGSGGKITIPTKNTSKSHAIATGGGAANLFGLPAANVRGGDAQVTSADMTRGSIATGGGGCGGTGGDAVYQGTAGWYVGTGGGGSAGSGGDYTGTPSAGQLTAAGMGSLFTPQVLFPFSGAGLAAHYNLSSNPPSTTAGLGAGAGGLINATTTYPNTMTGGAFGGGGGTAGYSTITSTITTGGGQYGGGGGGVCHSPYDTGYSGTLTSGAGGQGVAFVFFLSDFGKVLT